MKIRRFLDLLLTFTLALFTLGIALLGVHETGADKTMPLWFLPVGILMVLVLPGYSITVSTLPSLERPTILLMALGISICVDIVGGLILNLFPGGLQVTSWSIWLSSITLLACLIGFVRRLHQPAPETTWTAGFLPNAGGIFLFLVTILITLGAVYANQSSAQQSQATFTQLWAIPSSTDGLYTLEISIQNKERLIRQYNLYVESAGKKIDAWSEISIDPDHTWTTRLTFMEIPYKPINVYLYLSDSPEKVYRWVRIVPEAFEITPSQEGAP
ncbi:MAG TPA: DUF1616 domain-containing protein [Anaerolineales bacterium]|nr:DUF1616 domain-containing protein [Anaerolineales bacterium]HLO33521.1 DUF1616 domain-containing protein [Anaerolineales bacterium]